MRETQLHPDREICPLAQSMMQEVSMSLLTMHPTPVPTQNAAARLDSGTKRSDLITLVLEIDIDSF